MHSYSALLLLALLAVAQSLTTKEALSIGDTVLKYLHKNNMIAPRGHISTRDSASFKVEADQVLIQFVIESRLLQTKEEASKDLDSRMAKSMSRITVGLKGEVKQNGLVLCKK